MFIRCTPPRISYNPTKVISGRPESHHYQALHYHQCTTFLRFHLPFHHTTFTNTVLPSTRALLHPFSRNDDRPPYRLPFVDDDYQDHKRPLPWLTMEVVYHLFRLLSRIIALQLFVNGNTAYKASAQGHQQHLWLTTPHRDPGSTSGRVRTLSSPTSLSTASNDLCRSISPSNLPLSSSERPCSQPHSRAQSLPANNFEHDEHGHSSPDDENHTFNAERRMFKGPLLSTSIGNASNASSATHNACPVSPPVPF